MPPKRDRVADLRQKLARRAETPATPRSAPAPDDCPHGHGFKPADCRPQSCVCNCESCRIRKQSGPAKARSAPAPAGKPDAPPVWRWPEGTILTKVWLHGEYRARAVVPDGKTFDCRGTSDKGTSAELRKMFTEWQQKQKPPGD